MTKLYRAVAYILDLNGDCPSIKSVIENIENNRHPEFIHVHEVLETDCGEWNDDHELNYANAPYEKYFPEINPKVGEAELATAYRNLRFQLMRCQDLLDATDNENEKLRQDIKKLHKVQEFVKTIGELTS
jgi:hypothetical protein